LVIFALTVPLVAQQAPSTPQGSASAAANPLAELKDEVKRVLAEANLPFTVEQERSVILMMEDRRQASEDLFGSLLDFQAGPTRGEDADHFRSAIEWMRQEFLTRLQDYLRPEQLAVWTAHQEKAGQKPISPALDSRGESPRRQQAQTQYVRINNNAFTAE